MDERTLTTKCIKKLRERGALAVKIHGGPHQPVGLPDIVGCYKGTFFGIEMKMPKKRNNLTEKQAKKLRDIEEAGGVVAVCTSVKEVLFVLSGIDDDD